MEILDLKTTTTGMKNLLEELNRRFKMEKNSELKDKSMEIIISENTERRLK